MKALFLCLAAATAALPARAADAADPIETIIVIGRRVAETPLESALEPTRSGRLSTLPDLFRTQAGLIVEPVFGGIDHPRFAIRGSGLQRGTQPAGRGIELRLDGLPMTYADTSFDFVEWIDPLSFDSVSVLRGGRGVLAAGAALGGVVDFRGLKADEPLAGLARGEISGFGGRRAQATVGGKGDAGSALATATWFSQEGFRDFNAQEAWRLYANADTRLSETVTLRGGFLHSASELELPGPQTLAQIDSGSRAAQPGNVAGNWRRKADRTRLTLGLDIDRGATEFTLNAGLMDTDVDFTRRDVQVEANRDWSLASRLRHAIAGGHVGAAFVYQDGRRDQQLYLNGGGTMPTFTGERGLLWADNRFDASRLSALATADLRIAGDVRLDLAGGISRHQRRITELFPTRTARPPASLDRSYSGFTGLALLSWQAAPTLELFGSLSRAIEPPTWDTLYINVAGMGSGTALVNGPNPRRPVIVDLDAARDFTAEIGIKGRTGPLSLDLTLYRSWLTDEIVSTSDFVQQVVTSVGNADATRRLGIEATSTFAFAAPGLQSGDWARASLSWTWTDARFSDDPQFGDNRLPILPPHLIEIGMAYGASRGFFADMLLSVVPQGGWADYANTLRDDGRAVLGGRIGWQSARVLIFAEGRNLTNTRYAASVITAQNNLGAADASAFAPGEGRAATVGIEARF